jgi:hypothetical protein
MGAPLGFKTFATGDVLTAADTNGYLMQGIWVFATSTARDAAVTSPQEGNACYLKDTDVIQVYSGSAWVTKSATATAATYVGCALNISTSGQSIATNTGTSILFDTEVIDTDGFHSTSSNTDRITIPSGKAGKYLCTVAITMSANSTGARVVNLAKNGSTAYGMTFPATSSGASFGYITYVLDLAVGDYITASMFHTAGTNLNVQGVNTVGAGGTALQATLLGV